jgi:gag-polypeptide of LTR copia-type/Zinc knuckle
MESLDGSAIRLLEYLEPTALILWRALENRFDQNDDERRAELNRLLWSRTATMSESFDVNTHYTDHLSIIARLAALGTIVSANDSRSTFLESLPQEFDVLASAITITDMNEVVKQLTTYHRKQQLKRATERGNTSTTDMNNTSLDQNVALAAVPMRHNGSAQGGMLCHVCKQPGHFARECPVKASGGNQYNNGFNDKQQQYHQLHQGRTYNNQQSQSMHRTAGNGQQSATGGGAAHGYGNVNGNATQGAYDIARDKMRELRNGAPFIE